MKILIIDDERHARQKIKTLLSEFSEDSSIEECGNGVEAIEKINQLNPDLVFLDIQIPGKDAFGVLKEVELELPPIIILVTAFDSYAIRALEHHVFDYILKPFSKERFKKVLDDAKRKLNDRTEIKVNKKIIERLVSLPEHQDNVKSPNRILIKEKGKYFFLNINEIIWIEAAGDYIKIHLNKNEYSMRETLKNIESKLDPEQFFRIHRTSIININHILEMRHWNRGDYIIFLSNQKRIISSTGYRKNVERLLQKGL